MLVCAPSHHPVIVARSGDQFDFNLYHLLFFFFWFFCFFEWARGRGRVRVRVAGEANAGTYVSVHVCVCMCMYAYVRGRAHAPSAITRLALALTRNIFWFFFVFFCFFEWARGRVRVTVRVGGEANADTYVRVHVCVFMCMYTYVCGRAHAPSEQLAYPSPSQHFLVFWISSHQISADFGSILTYLFFFFEPCKFSIILFLNLNSIKWFIPLFIYILSRGNLSNSRNQGLILVVFRFATGVLYSTVQ